MSQQDITPKTEILFLKKIKDIWRFLNVLFKVMNDDTSVRMIPMVEPSAGAREKTTMEMQYIKSDT